ncbi:transcriptional regulator [Rathayibacter caricis DSM 15933]|uniref:Transcriptional regulator n=1 Tax=Rathayibacter caricis DSM 15933 TaxID=1328867 RepID=A0A2T4UQU2_9MICO|nr:helix-turn-helix transcriptional regulator [Rathayibacter caricis]PTL71900.1 transcriptional regulator [Rathayibacter caricis DSM 15933]
MDTKNEVRDFLTSRRGRVTAAQAGLPDLGGDRRVPGLRREEVAMLAGVSLDYYNRLERGNLRGASEGVLNGIARALQLDDAEREHLFHLAQGEPLPTATHGRPAETTVRSSVQRVLDNMAVPAVVTNSRQDMVAANALGRALYSPHFESQHPNMARFIFLDSRAPTFYDDWPLARRMTAAMLRLEAGRDPLNEELTSLIGELSTRSPHFRQEWATFDVHEHRTGQKTFHHPVAGSLQLTFDAFEMPGEPGLSIVTYSTEPGTPDAERLGLLASWVAPS